MNNIIQTLVDNFDLAFILSINVLTYSVIKIIDYFNGTKKVACGIKRLILVICAILLGIVYKFTTEIDNKVLINSIICAPIIYSWIIKPILKKIGVGYKTDK